MGKRQRHSQFIGCSIAELERIVKDKSATAEERLKAVTELKFHKRRNRQKRSK